MFKLMDKKIFTCLCAFFLLYLGLCVHLVKIAFTNIPKYMTLTYFCKINESNFDIKVLLLIAYILRVLYSVS